jgi:hypothetical protein
MAVGIVEKGDRDTKGHAEKRGGGRRKSVHGCINRQQGSVLCHQSDAVNGGLPVLTCLVIDRHILVGKAVGGLLAEHCGLSLVAVFSSVAQALVFMENIPPPAAPGYGLHRRARRNLD